MTFTVMEKPLKTTAHTYPVPIHKGIDVLI
jgi:hypothetical protein